MVRAAVADALTDLEPGERVLVALSGGPDSLALIGATVSAAAARGLLCGAVVVDHGLQEGSEEVAAHAAVQATLLGCGDVRVLRVPVATGPGSGGPEAAARAARYTALDAAAQGSGADLPVAAVLLGHTADDQAETVLLGLARGSGLRSLAGMAARTGVYRRPLLEVPRTVVRAAAEEQAHGDPRLAAWADPHNEDDRFARARVRARALPELESALGPGVVAGLVRSATLAREDADALEGWADAVWERLWAAGSIWLTSSAAEEPTTLPGVPAGRAGPGPRDSVGAGLDRLDQWPAGARDLAALAVAGLTASAADPPARVPVAIRSRIIRRLLLAAGCPAGALTAQHVRAVLALADGPARNRAEIALPGGRQARREGPDVRVRV